jgi:hypothetical protein
LVGVFGWKVQKVKGMAYLDRVLYTLFNSFPEIYWDIYQSRVDKLNLDGIYLIISCDCDTDEDIDASIKLHEWASKRKIKLTFAVPGTQLINGANVYGEISKRSEFINHGYLAHAKIYNGEYVSTTFYNEMPFEEVKSDIENGHHCIEDILNKSPNGFRAPHFGHFQSRAQLSYQYKVLNTLEYQYSTSTVSLKAALKGAIYKVNGLYEMPLTGTYSNPCSQLDSWTYLLDKKHYRLSEKYKTNLISLWKNLSCKGINGVINIYVDPSHVVNDSVFREGIEFLLQNEVKTIDYHDLINFHSKVKS